MFDIPGESNYIPLTPELEVENQLNMFPGADPVAPIADKLELSGIEEMPVIVETRSSSREEGIIEARKKINGKKGSERLVGTKNKDTINGGNGNDTW